MNTLNDNIWLSTLYNFLKFLLKMAMVFTHRGCQKKPSYTIAFKHILHSASVAKFHTHTNKKNII
jgi:hypothetical protein